MGIPLRNSFLKCLKHKKLIRFRINMMKWNNLRLHLSKRGEQMNKSFTKKLFILCSSKGPITTDQKANLIHCFTCLWHNGICIGKTDRNIINRLHEHGICIDQSLHINLKNCNRISYISNIMHLLDLEISVA